MLDCSNPLCARSRVDFLFKNNNAISNGNRNGTRSKNFKNAKNKEK
jgi:hypothetical protein